MNLLDRLCREPALALGAIAAAITGLAEGDLVSWRTAAPAVLAAVIRQFVSPVSTNR